MTIDVCENQITWDKEILTRKGHPLQLWGWGEVKATHNWRVRRVLVKEQDKIIGAAQLLIRPLPGPFKALTYIPRGPVCEEEDRDGVLDILANYTRETFGGVALTVEPDWEEMPEIKGWRRSPNTIMIPRTLILDLTKTEDELLADMTGNVRNYIRKGSKTGIDVRQVKSREELTACLEIYQETARRAGFGIHDSQYYYDIFDKLGEHSPVFAAFYEGKPVAFTWLAMSSETGFELYAGMNDQGKRIRASYALKWYGIQTLKRWGVRRYDLNGLLNDSISTFKRGFGSQETMLVGTYDKPLSPLYTTWTKALPLVKKVVRAIKNR